MFFRSNKKLGSREGSFSGTPSKLRGFVRWLIRWVGFWGVVGWLEESCFWFHMVALKRGRQWRGPWLKTWWREHLEIGWLNCAGFRYQRLKIYQTGLNAMNVPKSNWWTKTSAFERFVSPSFVTFKGVTFIRNPLSWLCHLSRVSLLSECQWKPLRSSKQTQKRCFSPPGNPSGWSIITRRAGKL